MKYDKVSDIDLWNRFKNGNPEFFADIFRNYYSLLFHYGCKITRDSTLVEDTIQELFIDLWRSNGKAEISSLRAYLLKAFKFKLIRSVGKARKLNVSLAENELPFFELSHEMFMIIDGNHQEASEKINEALLELSPRQKEIIYLKFHQNISYEEVGEVMHISYQAARNLLYQSVKVLKKIMSIPILLTMFIFLFE